METSDTDTAGTQLKLIQIIRQFATELQVSFPEFAETIAEWVDRPDTDCAWNDRMIPHIIRVYPPHFFNIMFKTDTFFQDSTDPLYLLPGLDFCQVMTIDNITEDIRNTIWDYLHAILFSTIPLVKDKTQFHDAAYLFESVPDEELSERMYNAFKTCAPLMDDTPIEPESESKSEDSEPNDPAATSTTRLKDMLERLMGSKLGRLSKTLMDELRPEIQEMFPELDLESESNQTNVFKLLMKKPTKIISLIKRAKEKMDIKLKNGEVSREELMEDMTELMKDSALKKEMEQMMKQMGGKNMFNSAAMRTEMAKTAQRNRMRQKREQKQQTAFFQGSTVQEEVFRVDNDTTEPRTTVRPQTEEEIVALIAELEREQKQEQKKEQLLRKSKKTKSKKK